MVKVGLFDYGWPKSKAASQGRSGDHKQLCVDCRSTRNLPDWTDDDEDDVGGLLTVYLRLCWQEGREIRSHRTKALSRTHVNLDGWTENCIPLCPLGSDVDVVVEVVILVTRILIIIIPSKNNVTIHFLLISKLFSWVDSSVTEEGDWKNRRGWERDGLHAPLGRLWIVIQLVVVDVLIVIVILLYGTPNPGVLFCEIGCTWHCLLWYEGTHASSCLSWMAEWIDVGLSCTLPKLYRSGWEMLWKGSI